MDKEIAISEDGFSLMAIVTIPEALRGVVVCAHTGGHSRSLERNRYIAQALNRAGYATILTDLLTDEEASDRGNVFDIDLLSSRVESVTRWVGAHPRLRNLPFALYGAGTGAAAALKAAAHLGDQVQSIISQGGRPDLATEILAEVHAPTLFVVGSEDHPVVELNQWASKQMNAPYEIKVVEEADHLFDEPGALEELAMLTRQWLDHHLESHPAWKTAYMRLQQQYII